VVGCDAHKIKRNNFPLSGEVEMHALDFAGRRSAEFPEVQEKLKSIDVYPNTPPREEFAQTIPK
jgi:hypothetical protein